MTRSQVATAGRRPATGAARTVASVVAVLLLAGAVLVNVVQFGSIEAETDDSVDAVRRAGTADLFVQGNQSCAACRNRYGLHQALRAAAPGSRVIVPASSPYAAERYLTEELTLRLHALGGAAEVEWVSYAQEPGLLAVPGAGPAGAAGLDPSPFIIATGPGGRQGAPWALALAPPAGQDLPGEPDRYLEQALAQGEHRDSSGQPREFVLLSWQLVREGSRYDYHDLLLESSLLPAGVRTELTL